MKNDIYINSTCSRTEPKKHVEFLKRDFEVVAFIEAIYILGALGFLPRCFVYSREVLYQ